MVIVGEMRQMRVKLRKAQQLITDMQQSCSRHQHTAADADKRARLALNHVCICICSAFLPISCLGDVMVGCWTYEEVMGSLSSDYYLDG